MNPKSFNPRLESLRGLAAMMVAGSHCFLFGGSPWSSALTEFLMNFINGAAAVILFFVLSGYVLGLSVRRFDSKEFLRDTLRYAIRRAFRIYPAFFLFTLLLGLTFGMFLPWKSFGASDWMNNHPHEPITLRYLVSNLLFADTTLNPVTWTLKVELVCSLALPFVHWLSTRLSVLGRGGLLLALIVGPKLVLPAGTAIRFLFLFYLGYLLPMVGPPLVAFLVRRRRWVAQALITAFACWLFGYHTPIWTLLQGLGAALFLSLLLYGPASQAGRLLETPAVRFYGKISYSFYLVHMKTMVALGIAMLTVLPDRILTAWPIPFGLLLWFLSVLVATPLAWMFCVWVEIPIIRWSKQLTASLRFAPPKVSPSLGTTTSRPIA